MTELKTQPCPKCKKYQPQDLVATIGEIVAENEIYLKCRCGHIRETLPPDSVIGPEQWKEIFAERPN